MPTATALSADELERICASVSAPTQTDRDAKRLALKAKSEQRTSQWPNTLEAMRKKKDRWKKDREEREEAARQRIDEEERLLQQERQTQQIQRANRLVAEQTDRMKALRSQLLLADVVQHRKLQLEEKRMLQAQDAAIDRMYDRHVLEAVFQGQQEEQAQMLRARDKQRELAMVQKQQLEEYKQRYIAQLREEKRDGELMEQKAEEDNREELEKERERRMRAKQAREDTELANMRLLALREQQKRMELEEDRKREEAEAKKQMRDAKRDELQRQKREKAQARKQRMIDLATQNLVNMEAKNAERLALESDQVRDKEDKDWQSRADRRAEEKAAIDRSRQSQLQHKAEAREQVKQHDQQIVHEWQEYGARIERQLQQEEQETRLDNLRIAVSQKQQADARRKTRMEERAAELLHDQEATQFLAREDERFREVAMQALTDAEQHGIENVVPIKKAVAQRPIDLLAASGFRI